jgi:nitrite reductase (NADH) small subunit
MSNFTKVAIQPDLPAVDEVKELLCGNKTICVANVSGTYSAMDNVCLHLGGPLGEGTIENGKVVCPWHGWQWDPKTGAAADHPDQKLKTYPIRVENGEVFIDLG